eukprot:gene22015-28499_t
MDHDEKLDAHGITKPLSAYQYFSKINSQAIKEELLGEGKDASVGNLASALSTKWRSLSDPEREKYEILSADDKARYQAECESRDEEFLRQQEERRKANSVGEETETRMRGSTLKVSDAVATKRNSVVKRTRELSGQEKERNSVRKQAKNAEESVINSEMKQLQESRAQQAEARLKFLLSQSDIFSHFGAVKEQSLSSSGKAAASAPGRRATSSSSAAATASEDLDEDEKAMLDEEEDEANESIGKTTMLLKQPTCITGGALRYYQLDSLNWMIKLQANGINGILADEMGLGKTLQSISVLAYMREFRHINGPHLVMVPKSTLPNWCKEFEHWCPVIRILRFHGNKDERAEIVQNHLKPGKQQSEKDWDVVVTTYEVVNLEKTALCKIAWKYLIIDEAHRLKNEASQFSQTVRLLNTQYRLLLTGTPLQNNLHELWALLNYLLPDVFASSEQFDDWFNLDVDDTEAKQRIIGQLHKLLRPFMLRRLKVEVEKSLPPKSETILFTGMSTMQKNLYKQVLLRDIDTINGAGTNNNQGNRTAILNIVMQLRKCCNHPYLFPAMEDRTLDPLGDHLYQNCGKMVLLDKLLKKMKERGHRVLIFSQMTRMLDILEDYIISQGYQYCRIDGNTTYEEREDRIYEYNKQNSEKFIFILSTRAGGLGINLQTADTVIIYDSDWNPQADLQAQDRAHRIGQKNPVQVFRLVTDDTVEVKVVERAQQKLKLDAMVVQQGRLQDKEKKLTKQDLLDTIRFGADKVFRTKESTITDEDIDMILEKGRKRTDEMNEKLQLAEKGDIYDFKLDGGMSTQVFEGKDYANKNMRVAELNAMAGIFIDPGKRERKAINSYADSTAKQTVQDEGDKRQKLPRHLRLNKMEDWQFFDKARLNELQAEEIRLFDLLLEKGEAPQSGNIGKFVVLSPELQQEKTRLIAEAFGDWTRVHFNNFIKASAKHRRHEYEKIAKDVGRPVDDIKHYAIAFWGKGGTELPPAEWERVTKQIEKGEKRIEEINRLTSATAKLIMMFEDPWEELTFRNLGNQNRIFNAVEDRFLLCLTHLHGYGNWDLVKNSIRRCERFRFDFYLQSCSAEALGKRCEALMKSAERELSEIEKKRLAADQHSIAASAGNSGAAHSFPNAASRGFVSLTTSGNAVEVAKEKLAEVTRQITEEAKKLANARAQLTKTKNVVIPAASTAGGSAANMKAFLDSANNSTGPSASTATAGVEKEKSARGGSVPSCTVPEGLLPELC